MTYVDDFLLDGEKEDILWFDAKLDSRFKCKPIEFVTEGVVIDYIGIDGDLVDQGSDLPQYGKLH